MSVRDVEEAEAALRGGADLVDVKDPTSGSLGKADDAMIQAIAQRVSGRVPVSAAMGEWHENHCIPAESTLQFVKWGPSGAGRDLGAWQRFLLPHLSRTKPRTVIVAYADWECAQAPAIERIVQFACSRPGSLLLIDTHCKEAGNFSRKPTLLDWLPVDSVQDICKACRAADVRIALAGSLGIEEIMQLRSAQPDWFAIRGAACSDNDRTRTICAERVRAIKSLLVGRLS